MTDFLIAPWQWPRSVSSILLVAPTEEPLTLAEGKLRAGLDWPTGDPRDAMMLQWIKAARQKVELDTGLALIRQTRRVTLDITVGATLVLPLPMHALPLLEVLDPVGRRSAAVVSGRGPLTLTIPDAVSGEWQIVSGWPDAATLAAEAPLLTQAVGLLTAHLATLGRDLASIDETFETPLGYEDAIAPFRLMWVI